MDYHELNQYYKRLDDKKKCILSVFNVSNVEFKVNSAYYNGHYSKNNVGEYEMEYYPIPVIGIERVCDIEIHSDVISVTSKLTRHDAMEFDYSRIMEYHFEAFGVENYLDDYYPDGDTFETMIENINKSNEAEIGYQFSFEFTENGEELLKFVRLLRSFGFYY